MAEYYNTNHIAKSMREYVKSESRRIRLDGVRARVLVLSLGSPASLSCLKAFSWADITTVIKKLKGDMHNWKSIVERSAFDSSIHGIIIAGRFPCENERQELCNMIPVQKDILCQGAPSMAAALCAEKFAHIPAISDSVIRMLRYSEVEYVGKSIMLLGSGNTMRALGFMLMNAGACVSMSAATDKNTSKIAEMSDILITKLDSPNSVNYSFMNERQVIVDLGKNTGADGRVTGDIVFRDAEKFVRGIFIGKEASFYELTDYIICEHVLKSADNDLRLRAQDAVICSEKER